jgi:DNA-binding transcriptional ArsR family regulator
VAGLDEELQAIADPTRRRILRLVRDREIPAGGIADEFPEISRPSVSQHLRVLLNAGLLTVRRDGNRRLFRLRPAGLTGAAAFIDDLWADSLSRLKRSAEREESEARSQAAGPEEGS